MSRMLNKNKKFRNNDFAFLKCTSQISSNLLLLQKSFPLVSYVQVSNNMTIQESLANAKVSARQQCIFEGP